MRAAIVVSFLMALTLDAYGQGILDRSALIRDQAFFDNQDWDWFVENIPFLDCPDADIQTTYYYRWELMTKHLTYGNPDTGYLFTEFIDRPFWSGAYGGISCPAGHQLYEARWLRQGTIAKDYSKYWLETPGAQPRNYSTWLADSVLAVDAVHPDAAHVAGLLDRLIANDQGWRKRHYDPTVGLFWQTGHDDGMEFNIASRQTQDILRGAPSYRPSFNAYMWADAKAIAQIAARQGRTQVQQEYDDFAQRLRETMVAKLWDPKRKFFFPMFKNNENRDGYEISAGTLVYEQGRFAGDSHGRELIGYVPWQFQMFEPDSPYEVAWAKLMDRDGFFAEFGPSTVERNDPMFLLQKSCCWWSGQSWPYATTQTLKALANVLQRSKSPTVTSEDYVKMLRIYAKSHRKDGKPYLAEALHPDTGSFEGHDGYNHSEHYFHSGFCDLVITGLVGVQPSHADEIILHPLAPSTWDYLALDGLVLRGHEVSILWDRTGERYKLGKGLSVFVDGKRVAQASDLSPIRIDLAANTAASKKPAENPLDRSTVNRSVNHLVNNDGSYFPRASATSTRSGTSIAKLQDGNHWYMQHPPNRWESATSEPVTIEIDLGTPRQIESLNLFFLDDSMATQGHGSQGDAAAAQVRVPAAMKLECYGQGRWEPIDAATIDAEKRGGLQGRRPTKIALGSRRVEKIRIALVPEPSRRVGLTEIEAWGTSNLPYPVAAPPAGNLVYRPSGKEYPKASASHSDRFGGTPEKSNDGKTVFDPNPMNRWTSYESTESSDWLEFDLGEPKSFRRVELAIYDDRGGVQAPESYTIEVWSDGKWVGVEDQTHRPEKPAGSQWNEASFTKVTSSKFRIVFRHKLPAKSGVTEVMLWEE
ncbi:MAG: discoidin domain-containing protein [Planctomycetota bacterium]|nr:discoidin domain-containing protein [Planctomycetota bacterium]